MSIARIIPLVCLLAVGASQASELQPFALDQRLVTAYYFNWYIDGVTHKSHAWHIYPDPKTYHVTWCWTPEFPKSDAPGAEAYGLDRADRWPGKRLPDTSKWPDSDDWIYQIAELRAMKWAGLDFALVDLWPLADFQFGNPEMVARGMKATDGRPAAEPDALFRAWRWLDARDEDPVKLSVIVDTPGVGSAVDLRTSEGLEKLWAPLRNYVKQFLPSKGYRPVMPARALAAMEGRPSPRPMVHIFFPRLEGEASGNWIAGWDRKAFDELHARFRKEFGVDCYLSVNQHLHGPKYGGWNGVQADGSTVDISRSSGAVENDWQWFASLHGPLVSDDAIAISPGFWYRDGGQALPAGGPKDDAGEYFYPRAFRYTSETDRIPRYESDWLQVLRDKSNFRRHIVVIETWNELGEGSGIDAARPEVRRDASGAFIDRWGDSPTQYLELTREYSRLWKSGVGPTR